MSGASQFFTVGACKRNVRMTQSHVDKVSFGWARPRLQFLPTRGPRSIINRSRLPRSRGEDVLTVPVRELKTMATYLMHKATADIRRSDTSIIDA